MIYDLLNKPWAMIPRLRRARRFARLREAVELDRWLEAIR